MSLADLLSSTKTNPQSNNTAHVPQPSNLTTNPSNSIQAVYNTQASSLQRDDISASEQVASTQKPAPDGQIVTPPQASNLPGHLAASQQHTASLSLIKEPTTSRSNQTAIPLLGQLHPSSSLSHAPTSMAPLATPPPLTQPFLQTEPTPPPPPDQDMSH